MFNQIFADTRRAIKGVINQEGCGRFVGFRAINAGCMVLASTLACGCGPAQPPPDLLKTQRQALDKAKQVQGQMQQQAQDQAKAEEQQQ